MSEVINQIAIVMQQALMIVGYPGIFAVVFVENFLGPIPSPPLLPLSGMLASQGRLNFFVVWFVAVAGALIGALALYGVGAWADERVIRRAIRRYGRVLRFSEAQLDRSLDLFRRYGVPTIFFGRIVPVLRNAVSLAAGMSHLPLPTFIAATLLISTPSIGAWLYAGYALGENWHEVLDVVNRFEGVILAGVGAAALVLLMWIIRRRWKQRAVKQTAI